MSAIYATKILAVMDALKALIDTRAAAEGFTGLEVKIGMSAQDRTLLREGVYILAPGDATGPAGFPSDFKRDTTVSLQVLVRTRDLRQDDSGTRRLVQLVGLVFDTVGANTTLSDTCAKALPQRGEPQEADAGGGMAVYDMLLTIDAQLIYRMR